MARRIGFGDGADRERARQREKDAVEAAAASAVDGARTPGADGDAPASDTPEDAKTMSRAGRIALSVFLTLWLFGWSVGIYNAALGAVAGDDAFLVIWLIFAVAGWIVVASILYKAIAGRPMRLKRRSRQRRS